MPFLEKLQQAMEAARSLLCIGLDIVPERLPRKLLVESDGLFHFNRAIVEATQDLVCAYKLNMAFYQALGREGWELLRRTIDIVPSHIPVILDAKFNDVGHSTALYARAAFEVWGCDAVTVNPYLGLDGVEPFLSYADRGVFVLARTSNPGAGDLQDLRVDGEPLYMAVARQAQRWNRRGNCGLVVGATFPEEMERLRRAVPKLPFLIPGIGAQGGDLEAAIVHGTTADGLGPIVAVSRSIIYASPADDFAEAARGAADELRREMNRIGRCLK